MSKESRHRQWLRARDEQRQKLAHWMTANAPHTPLPDCATLWPKRPMMVSQSGRVEINLGLYVGPYNETPEPFDP